ncbi:unnamed protein product [Rotaria magnacalcarata]|uniref:O(6)-methylguanine-induced apoptosis 2 n=3 Tax=Rotaria magnacalcarata TaxID=392030 RepID=A0A816PV13_9BILA|nr:unnamed protein product [Rotaria magnacalcarata]
MSKMTMAGTDSVAKGNLSQRSRYIPSESNKVHRGFTVCATGTPSIPYRYLTIISSNGEKQGFQQTAKRFQYDPNFTPGPGQYQTVQSLGKQLERTSDSKKGSGSFASKSKRDSSMNQSPNVPAPTSYNIVGIFDNEHQGFNRSKYSSMFQKPIVERPLSPKSLIPAPNQYDVDKINQGYKTITKSNNVSAQAAFRSHTKRSDSIGKQFVTPAPGAYNLDDSATRTSAHIHQSSFKSNSKRDAFSVRSSDPLPGPADYRPFEKLTEESPRNVLPRRHYLAISAPAIPPSPEPPYPGPGAYELRDYKGVEKKYMSSAAFVSTTSRWAIDTAIAAERPGPGSYTPRAPAKQSFNFNFERKWIG